MPQTATLPPPPAQTRPAPNARPGAPANAPASQAAAQRARQVELILSQIDALPTLSPVAVRVLQLTGDDNAGIGELTRLIEADPALTARVLTLCRRADVGVSRSVTSIDRVVVLLGLDALRAALLSAELYEMFRPAPEDKSDAGQPIKAFDAAGFWRHSVAVACSAEMIAERFKGQLQGVKGGEAYLCGLLHDLGKPALERVLPKAYGQVLALAEQAQSDLAQIEKRVLGLDHQLAGKRLAERWGLPHAIQDSMWLHGRSLNELPEIGHRATVALVTLADTLARRLHVGFSGNLAGLDRLEELAAQLGMNANEVEALAPSVIERVAERCAVLGLETLTDREVLLESLREANRRLAKISHKKAEQAVRGDLNATTALKAVEQFLSSSAKENGFIPVAGALAASAGAWFGASSLTLAWCAREGAPWRLIDFTVTDGVAKATSQAESKQAPPEGASLRLPVGQGPSALLTHNAPSPAPAPAALVACWGAVLSAAARHEGAIRLSERMVEANARLSKAEEEVARGRALAVVGRIAAVAADQMHAPLEVIISSAQPLSTRLSNPTDYRNVTAIERSAERIFELMQTLRVFADASPPRRVETDMNDLVARACKAARERTQVPGPSGAASGTGGGSSGQRGSSATISIRATVESQARFAHLDPAQVTQGVTELISNAIRAQPRSLVEVRVHADPQSGRLLIAVKDDGKGMSQEELAQAQDPLFSAPKAGRSIGLGLARARRFAELHAGSLALTSKPGQGTTATLAIADWMSVPARKQGAAA